MEQRIRLEERIRELGGEIPKKLEWDDDGMLRNNQLLETVEHLEKLEQDRQERMT